MTTKTAITTITDLKEARKGSYYTILGAGGDLDEWVEGYEEMLAEEKLGKPSKWYRTTGGAINRFRLKEVQAHGKLNVAYNDLFPDDLIVLMFPLTGMRIDRLAIFKLQMQDRWFDDVLDNMRGVM
jgi:hypothetical protein